MHRFRKWRFLCICIVFIIIFSYAAEQPLLADPKDENPGTAQIPTEDKYDRYIKKFGGTARSPEEIWIPAASYTGSKEAKIETLKNFEGRKDVLKWTDEKGWVEWEVHVPASGMYQIAFHYFPLEGKRREIELALAIDGKIPFSEAGNLKLERIWKDASSIQRSGNGNEYSPMQIEAPQWLAKDAKSPDGLYNEPFLFFLEEGKHILRLYCIRENFALDGIKLYNGEPIQEYQQIEKEYTKDPAKNKVYKYQAEHTFAKSDQTIRPVYDRSSPLTEPYHRSKIRLNTIGQQYWQKPGQWISWKIKVPEDGYYKLGFKFQQNYVRGLFVSRKLYIDGKVPFKEVENIRFPYGNDWDMMVPGDGDPYLFFLTQGEHEIKLEVTLGDLTEMIGPLENVVYDLNSLYRRIIMITSTNPDMYRDYNLDKEIPDLLEILKRSSDLLDEKSKRLETMSGQKRGEGVLLERVSYQLKSMMKDPGSIPGRLEKFKSNISGLSSWMLDIRNQPLDLDYILVMQPEAKLPRVKANVLQKLYHEVNSFLASFFENYNMMDVKEGQRSRKITLWLGWGRDQAQVLKSMIDDMFTPETGIQVDIKIVQASMIQAVLSGEGPDVSIMVPRGQPVNLALRGAVLDMSQFEEFGQVKSRFADTAMQPYEFNDGCYGIPDTQMFLMMFYRKDILNELGIEPPQTWDDLYNAIPVIQRSNMEIGIPYTSIDGWELVDAGMGTRSIFPALLFQHHGSFYNDTLSRSALNAPKAIEAFKNWTDFNRVYQLPLKYDFFNRFRTGEMPLAIASYGEYNMLSVAAPEIRNLWDMVPIPGTLREGGIDRAQAGAGTASVILSRTKDKDACWKFIQWWTGADAQERYATGIEAIQGTAARYPTVNMEAFSRLPWTVHELQSLMAQWKDVREIPEVPGGYYMVRSLDNAFKDVVLEGRNARESIKKWSQQADNEIKRKRQEFGFND